MTFPIMVEYYLKIFYLFFKIIYLNSWVFQIFLKHKYHKRGNNMTIPIISKVWGYSI
jgi:hypothetical protein